MKMNRFIFVVGLCLGALYGQAQIVLNAGDYFPAPGDTLFSVFDQAPEGVAITPPGGAQTWDFSGLQNDFTRLREVKAASEGALFAQFPGTEVLFPQGVNAEGYYNVADDRYELVGYAGQDPLGQGLEVVARFSPPYVERWAPLQFFDIRSTSSSLLFTVATDDIPGGIFDNLPVSPDSIRVRVAIQRTDVVDGWGNVTIPGNHTYEALREKRTEYRNVRLDAKVNPLPWFDITDLALQNLPIEGLGQDTIVRYHFWAKDVKEAVAVITAETDGQTIVDVEYKGDPLLSSAPDPAPPAPGRLALAPNPASGQTWASLTGLAPDFYTLQLIALDGRVMRQYLYAATQNTQAERLSLEGLTPGLYLCRLLDAAGKAISVEKLVVE
jgi:hypothetical protein